MGNTYNTVDHKSYNEVRDKAEELTKKLHDQEILKLQAEAKAKDDLAKQKEELYKEKEDERKAEEKKRNDEVKELHNQHCIDLQAAITGQQDTQSELDKKEDDDELRKQQEDQKEKFERELSEVKQSEAQAQQELWYSRQNEVQARQNEVEAKQNEEKAKRNEEEARKKEVEAENKLKQNKISILEKENEFLNLEINKCDILIDGCRNVAKADDFVFNKPDNLVALIGQSGNGKSTLGNRLLQDNSDDADQLFTTSDDFTEGCTEKAKHKFLDSDEKSVLNGNLCVVDTVGGSDPDEKKMDAFSINDTMDHLKGSGGVNYFIFVLSSKGRLNPPLARLLNQYASAFGKDFWDHLIVVFTHCDSEKACKRFMKKNVEPTRKLIGEKLPDSKVDNIIFIPIGIDCYTDQINEIYKKINGSNKISIDLLVTPYDKAVKDKVNLKTEYDKNLHKIKQLQN